MPKKYRWDVVEMMLTLFWLVKDLASPPSVSDQTVDVSLLFWLDKDGELNCFDMH